MDEKTNKSNNALVVFCFVTIASILIIAYCNQTSFQPITEKVRPILINSDSIRYKNKEEWEIVRGSDRLIEKIIVHRVVTENG